jgi:nucleolar protein 4
VEERRSIFVRSLPPDATSENLTDFFSEHFPVKHATVVVDQKTKESRGYGFVTFADAEDAAEAKKALDKKKWNGRNIRIDIAEPRHRSAGDSGEVSKARPGKPEFQSAPKLIIRNLPWSIKTPEQLSKLFISFGKVKFADLPQDKGKMKGFGFVTIRGKKNAEKALEAINGKEIDGRTLAVDWAVDKQTWDQQNQKDTADAKVADAVEDEEDDDDDDDDEEDDDREVVEGNEDVPTRDDELQNDLDNFFKNHMQNLEDESEEDEEEKKEEEKKPQPFRKLMTDNSATLFIRNLPFTTTDEGLKSFFDHFGKVRYARVVVDKATDKPAGTGFVCFFDAKDAKECIKGAPRPNKDAAAPSKQSILHDENADPDGKYTLDGRLLQVAQAVNKETAEHLASDSMEKRREKDKRKLYLLGEGGIGRGSPLFDLLTPMEIQMRQASQAQRRKLVQSNPSLHVSLTRIALRNMPRNIGAKELKELARKAIVGFAKDVKEGRRQPLSKEENARDGKDAKEKERERRLKGKGIVRQAKVVFESNQGSKIPEKSGSGKSRGYGFIEYTSHHWALMGLRYLNGLQVEGDNGRKQRLIAEFAIENAQVVQRRRAAEAKTHQPQKMENTGKGKEGEEEEAKGGQRALKRNSQVRGKRGPKGAVTNETKGDEDSKPVDPKEALKQTLITRKKLMRKKKAKARGGKN